MLSSSQVRASSSSVNASVKVKDCHFYCLQGKIQSTDTLPDSHQLLSLLQRQHTTFVAVMAANYQATQSLVMPSAAAAAKLEMLHGFTKYVNTVTQVLPHWMLIASRLLETGQGSDMTITCKGNVFKVHSAIVASRSDFFATACWGHFKVGVGLRIQRDKTNKLTQQEAEDHCIDLPDDDPAAVDTMLQYLYSLNYSSKEGSLLMCSDERLGQVPFPQLAFHIATYHMGDKYGIHGLKGMASEKFAAALKWDAGRPFSSISARALAIVISRIYDSTSESDNGLRHHILGFAKRHLEHLLALEDFKTVLAEIPEFSYQLLVQEVESRENRGEEEGTRKRKIAKGSAHRDWLSFAEEP